MKFRTKKQRKRPEFNTTALPDIIFMLLFFFMVATVLKTTSSQTELQLPKASQIEQIKKQKQVLHIHLGLNSDQTQTQLQIDDFLIQPEQLENAIRTIKSRNADKELIVALKADRAIKMHEINEVKTQLRKQNLRKMTYVSNQQ